MVQLPAVNTPQFSWCRTKLPNHPQPVPPIFQPEVPARGSRLGGTSPPARDHGRRKRGQGDRRPEARPASCGLVPRTHRLRRAADSRTCQSHLTAPTTSSSRYQTEAARHGMFDDRASERSDQAWATTHRGVIGCAAGVVRSRRGAPAPKAMSPPLPPSGEQIEITHGDQRAWIVEVGGALRAYRADGHDVLDGYEADERCTDARGQALIPWPNRLRNGSYRFGDEEHQLPLSEPARRNAIHGLVRWSSFTVDVREPDRVTMRNVLYPRDGYPFTLLVAIDYALSRGGTHGDDHRNEPGRAAMSVRGGCAPLRNVGTPLIDAAIAAGAGPRATARRRARHPDRCRAHRGQRARLQDGSRDRRDHTRHRIHRPRARIRRPRRGRDLQLRATTSLSRSGSTSRTGT